MAFWRDRTFRAIVIAVILVAAVGILRPGNISGVYTAKFWQTKVMWSNCADVVIAGDSRSAIGVSPAEMMEVLGDMRIVNFGFNGNGYSADYWEALVEVLDAESEQRTVVLGITPRTLTPAASAMNTFKAYRPSSVSEVVLTSAFSELLRFTEPMDLGKAFENAFGEDKGSTLHQEFFADGWIASSDDAPRPGRKLDNYIRDFENNPVDEGIVEQLLGQVREFREMGIAVFGFRPPTNAEMVSIEDELSGLDYSGFITRFEAAGGIWLELGGNEYFSYDGSHLDRDSAILLSQEIARALVEHNLGVIEVAMDGENTNP